MVWLPATRQASDSPPGALHNHMEHSDWRIQIIRMEKSSRSSCYVSWVGRQELFVGHPWLPKVYQGSHFGHSIRIFSLKYLPLQYCCKQDPRMMISNVWFLVLGSLALSDAFSQRSSIRTASVTQLAVVDMEKKTTSVEESLNEKIPKTLRIEGKGIPTRKSKVEMLDAATYESDLIKTWGNDPDRQSGFDWEIEKLRRYFAGLRMREDGTWVKKSSAFDFLISKQRVESRDRLKPVNVIDVAILFSMQLLSSIGLGPALGLDPVPTAVIQKYEGSFLSFIKGVLGGDLQTLAGGPLFLLLNKYFLEYGPIFNLAFGPKAFLVISDPAMARHILKDRTPDQYCKGMLSEILEPIMGKGLIPADPVTWKVGASTADIFSCY